MIPYVKAELVLRQKIIEDDGSIVEMKIWQVRKTLQYPLGVRYSLFWIQDGAVRIGYDNHFPKGPHRHEGDREESYNFISVEKLIADFQKDRERLKT